ncbi:hypothetical protein VPH35_129707 [Triticum aestivum]|uniref:uncharacterized protein n=1 Tax=Triticum aestivum TaxID=4565 RepID=UPI001D018FB1|nr:uncharacterized protein LOC123175734 [Triticum aestivum]
MAGDYLKVYKGLGSRKNGFFDVEVWDNPAEHSDHSPITNLHNCNYTTGGVTVALMAWRGSENTSISDEQYTFLTRLRDHPNALVVENHFKIEDIGCLVVEPVRGTFLKWLTFPRQVKLITDGRMSPILRKMIVTGVCGLVSLVLRQNLYLEHLRADDLYIKQRGNGEPTLKVLLSGVRKNSGTPRVESSWHPTIWTSLYQAVGCL